MFDRAIATLGDRLGPHLPLSKDRLETLVLLVTAMLSARTVNLSHLAAERPGRVKIASSYRRFQRFFQYVRLGRDWSASLVAEVMGLSGSWYLALDRTQWRIGAHDVNFLVLAAVTRRVRVPLMWTVIRGPGCSDTGGRIALMRRYLKVFEAGTIRLLLADREFVGRAWIDFLCENNIPFAIRLKGDLRITTDDGAELTLEARVHARGRGRVLRGWLGFGRERGRHRVTVAAKRLGPAGFLFVVTNREPRLALAAYRRRWAIECLFGDVKTRGLNLEDTRLTQPENLDLLMGVVALAIAWAARTALLSLAGQAPRRGAHGYLVKSWFRIGFDQVRRLLRSDPAAAIHPWLRLPQAPSLSRARVV
jgi:Transposase DDE domain